ncbi:RNA ligase family protein [Hamadaea sp. NPDC051192]|uniref:RNA ligase family protein n=1 Tax=Hamadaea sp. NPDC051192 TaxID=3154940 RepID=UPI0034440AC0
MTAFNVRAANLPAINSMTKYPSIPTYHSLDPRNGGLLDETVPFAGVVVGTEKVDGTNSRIILLPDGTYLLGSREELLYAKGDLIGNPALGIVDALRPIADRLPAVEGDRIVVHYLEVYGGKVTAASKQYTGGRSIGNRLFDVAVVGDYREMSDWDARRISGWRDDGGQDFLDEAALRQTAERTGLVLTPRLFEIDATDLPTDIARTKAFLDEWMPATLAALDGDAAGRAEGIVLRTPDRKAIAKARFQDYERTLKRRGR